MHHLGVKCQKSSHLLSAKRKCVYIYIYIERDINTEIEEMGAARCW